MRYKNNKFLSNVARAPAKQAVALPWYSETDYEDILGMMADREDLPNTYQEWLDLRIPLEQELFKDGYPVVRIMIQPEPFINWYRIQGLNPNAKACAEFAVKQAVRKARMNWH